jgi:enamine deaminase RidA (YjgF/YER057c/UK114 family)
MRWKGDDHSLPECSLTQVEAFSDLDDVHPSGSLRASRRRSPTSRRRSTASIGIQYRSSATSEVAAAAERRARSRGNIAESYRQVGVYVGRKVTGPGRTVYFAGQLGIDKSGKMGANAREQIEIAFENVKAALTSVGANFENVVKLNNYIVDIGTNIAHPAREGPCCTAGPSRRVDRALECHCLGFATLARAIRRAIRRGAYCLYAATVSESRFDATRPIASTIVQACLERLSATTARYALITT